MKKSLLLSLLISLFTITSYSQNITITPKNNPFDRNLIQDETYEMVWYAYRDTAKMEIGKVKTEVAKQKNNLLVITTVDMRNAQSPWTDSTLVDIKNLAPIYHSSFNQQRDMVINFAQEIDGYYLDKSANSKTVISENPSGSYFDSNIYPQLIRWLPLAEGYTSSIAIFDYNPSAKIGVMYATVKTVEKASLALDGTQTEVWKVTVTDDISDNAAVSTYYIDRTTRKILKQEIEIGQRKMSMELVK